RARVDRTLPTGKRMEESTKATERLTSTQRLKPTERKYSTLDETRRFTHPRKKKRERPPEGGNLLMDILTLPVLGAPRMAAWIGKKTVQAVEQEEFDEGALQGQLLDLQMRYELGEVSGEEYDEQETALLERLRLIREAKEEKAKQEGRSIRKG
ncbi:MAG: gas vesicle protein GvpG, partial [Dehalococcoidia bacterium]